ncbi:hypothetical protein JMA_03260 [Jeotgalibacillus malaysiensis]|uniref:Molecular chaperone Hsp33 n=1 Tax=Jeotgalibacillus malaysiensis TaxID=1508404 RepID=A0A0B5AM55_9BACL|nr:Hsp33 family molecular chaperone HslO [Jeotgalibacillus malaysiensis]AJD89643.1 hypothetical protein JMA_03260 [Jeotgalibacillus malaysiensis]
MSNQISKTLVFDGQVRLYFVNNTELVQELFDLHGNTPLPLKVMLGKTVSAMSILSGTLKGKERMNLQVTMSQQAYQLFAEAEASGNIRGYLNEKLLKAEGFENAPTKDIIGPSGRIRVIKGSGMNQFTSFTAMLNQDIDLDIANYFAQSDQTPTFIQTDIQLNENGEIQSSNAVYAQLLPGASTTLLSIVKRAFSQQTNLVSRLNTALPEELEGLFGNVKLIGSSSTQFFCGCTKEMFYGMLLSMNEEEMKLAIEKNEEIEAFCHICGKTYYFDQQDLFNLL